MFLDFCNKYYQVIELIIALLTLIGSIIAIWISIKTARLPYRKKLLVKSNKSYQITMSGEKCLNGYHITVTNIGSRPVVIKNMGFSFSHSKKVYTPNNLIHKSPKDCLCKIGMGEMHSITFDIENFVSHIQKEDFTNKTKVYAFAEDSEGIRHKCKIGRVKMLKELLFLKNPKAQALNGK